MSKYTDASKIWAKLSEIHKKTIEHPIGKKRYFKALLQYAMIHLGYYNKARQINWVGNLSYWYKDSDPPFRDNLLWGLYEYDDSLFLLKYLKKDDLFLDIGAYHGHYSLLSAGIKGCKTVAVEPIPQTIEGLKKNIQLNHLENLIEVLPIGLGSEENELFFSNDGSTTNKMVNSDYPSKVIVPVLKLDSLNIFPDLIKMDVEGFEYDVLQGGSKVLSNPRLNCVLCEINYQLRAGLTNTDVLDYFKKFSFFPYYYDGAKLVKLENDINQKSFNTIFIRDLEKANNRLSAPFSLSFRGMEIH